ncbi:MAG: hypothetical protein FOGNACKC_01952 [Anaerolineae bacterium]|nr:hypothetical protein [Anaerolineae bacterium]
MGLTDAYKEEISSQIPALQLLLALGYRYLTPAEALAARGGSTRAVVLVDILEPWLRANNRIRFKGQTEPFSDGNIKEALRRLTHETAQEGLLTVNERLYELLTLGTSLPQTVLGDTKSHSLQYIDWQQPQNNVYHVTDEFAVERSGSHSTRRPDIVCFVNGIPLAVIECKRPDLTTGSGEKAVTQAITQMVRNQKPDEIPGLFLYSQLLLALSQNDARYATTHTPLKFWAVWKEESPSPAGKGAGGEGHHPLLPLINRPLTQAEQEHLYQHRDYAAEIRAHFDKLGPRLPTAQDEALYNLLRPRRLLELVYQFIVFDNGVKKIARYQQYFAVKETIGRVAHLNAQGERTGGVIWHTTGSGKSITMVMLAKALALHPNIPNPRVIIVTDRIDLDDQIWRTFTHCGKKPVKAPSGKDLIDLVRAKQADIITTVINKFETVAKERVRVDDPDVFVLVDESHRSQYGSIQAKMRRVFRKSCYLGFTGTPLIKKDKQTTVQKFGSFIHTYSMRRAVEDGAVVPLLYEGRLVEQDVDQSAIDKWFERVTRELTPEQQLDLKRKFSRGEEVNRTEQRLRVIAYDLSEHYQANYKNTGFKAQLAAPSKRIALKYKHLLDEFGLVTSAVIISPPDTREGNEEVDAPRDPELEAFWKRMMDRYGSEERYNQGLKADFHREDGVELLIVVDKLLTGFDEPRNTVLYIDKPLKEHSLLQAIARVNRLFEGKPYGYIIDYRGVLGELNEAMETYSALEAYDPDDVRDAFTDVSAEIARLPQLHADLWAVFKTVPNQRDIEALQQFLAPEDIRQKFYEALTAFAGCFKVALSTVAFQEETPPRLMQRYKDDLRFFHNLRAAVKQRYAEVIDYKEYEAKIRKLMDSHIKADDVRPITALVNIFNAEQFDAEVARLTGAEARADTIAHRVKQTATENMDQDPAFYKKFSRLIDETIEAYRVGRLTEAQYLEQVTAAMAQMRQGHSADRPARLNRYKHAPAYYGSLQAPLEQYTGKMDGPDLTEITTDAAIRVEELIEARKVTDWSRNLDVQRRMQADIEDYLFSLKGRYGIPLTLADIEQMSGSLVELAKQREHL